MASVLLHASGANAADSFSVVDLRCEELVDPIGIDVANPRLSWRMEADHDGAAQAAYRVLCATTPKLLKDGAADLWDSGKTDSDQSQHIVYGGRPLKRGVPCHWSVRVWNEQGVASDWSKPGNWTLFDMLADDRWQAKWITQGRSSSPWLRRSFQLDSAPARAYIYVNVIGYFQLFINGKRVAEDEFAPHVGQLNKRSFCITYDVGKHLKEGKNTLGFWLGSGWARGGAGVQMSPVLRVQLEMHDASGKTTGIGSDETWRVQPSSIAYTGRWQWNKFGGEIHHGGRDEPDWANTDYDDSAWSNAQPANVSTPIASAEMLQRSRVIEELTPVTVAKLADSVATPDEPAPSTTSWLVDMGKAMTGTFELTFRKAPQGHKIVMEFGDSCDVNDGTVTRMNSFNQASSYICRGSGTERFRSRFNYASCRYIHIKNAPGNEMRPEDVKGYLIATELPKSSTFSCSDETLNKIYRMMEHTLRCLMLGGYQVDCHSRERYGYGGDGHSSLDTTLCLLRSDTFYRKWTRDWLDQQQPDGGLTYTSPASNHGGGPFWCGFLTAATLKHYHHYGDLALVERNYPAIKRWLELAQSKTAEDLQQKFCGGWYLGDWASPKGVNDKDNADAFIQPYMCYALEQGAQLAEALDKTDDAELFRKWAEARGQAAHRKLYDAEGKTYGSGDQVTSILALAGGIVPEELEQEVLTGFETTLKEQNKGHLSTGLSGTYMMVQYLQSIGRDDLIYLFASKTTYPSWGYMIENGATATWEHWDGRESRIHNCYNNIASWFIQGLAGIRPDLMKPGFKNAVIRPAVIKELDHVTASHDTVYGTIESNWKRDGESITMNVRIPPNATATIYVPATDVRQLTVNDKTADAVPHITYLRRERGRVLLQVTSGRYEIVATTDLAQQQ